MELRTDTLERRINERIAAANGDPVLLVGCDLALWGRLVQRPAITVSAAPDASVRAAAAVVWTGSRDDYRDYLGEQDPQRRVNLAIRAARRLDAIWLAGIDRLENWGASDRWDEADGRIRSRLRSAARVVSSSSITDRVQRWSEESGAALIDVRQLLRESPEEQPAENGARALVAEMQRLARGDLAATRLALTAIRLQVDIDRLRQAMAEPGHVAVRLLIAAVLDALRPRDALELRGLARIEAGLPQEQLAFDALDRLRELRLVVRAGDRLACHPVLADLLRGRLWGNEGEGDVEAELLAEDLDAHPLNGADDLDRRPFDLALLATSAARLDLLERVPMPIASYLKWRATELSRAGEWARAVPLYDRVLATPGHERDPYAIHYRAYNLLHGGQIDLAQAIPAYRASVRLQEGNLFYRKRLCEALLELGDDEWRDQLAELRRTFEGHDQLSAFVLPELASKLVQRGDLTAAGTLLDAVASDHRDAARVVRARERLERARADR